MFSKETSSSQSKIPSTLLSAFPSKRLCLSCRLVVETWLLFNYRVLWKLRPRIAVSSTRSHLDDAGSVAHTIVILYPRIKGNPPAPSTPSQGMATENPRYS